jgi:endoglucanase
MISRFWLAILLCATFSASSQAQLLKNPSFEEKITSDQWFTFAGKGKILPESNEKQDGNSSILITDRPETYAGPAQELKDVIKNDVNYRFSAHIKLKNSSLETLYLSAKQQDDNGVQYHDIDRLLVNKTGWVKLAGSLKPNISGELKSFIFYIHGANEGVDFYVDNVSVIPPLNYTTTPSQSSDFIRAKEIQLVKGSNEQPISLIGTNFIAYEDDELEAERIFNSKNFDEQDYKRVSEMGMNVVRLNMWYKVFEDDAKPKIYKPEGWEWLEKNLIWARKYGVYLILDMHAPQGGYQSAGYSGDFWNKNNKEYRERLKSLWKAIATRYKNDPIIAAYSLLNEPNPPTNKEWITYAQELVDEIRSVDKNHLIIVEQSFAKDNKPFVLKASNIMYEFHFYESFEYANQLIYTMGRGDGGSYPDATQRVLPWDMIGGEIKKNGDLSLGTSDWKFYEGTLHKIDNNQIIAATPALISENNTGKAFFDDFVIKEYDPQGKLVRQVISVDLEKKPEEWYFLEGTNPFISYAEEWKNPSSEKEKKEKIENIAHRGNNSISISNTKSLYTVQNPKFTFSVKKDYSYQISGWMKGEKITGSATFGFQLQKPKYNETIRGFDKKYLESMLVEFGIDFYHQKKVPVNIGEFGISLATFENNKGGLIWMNDVLDLFKQYNINAQYFNYHGNAYGIYRNVIGFPDPDAANKQLIELFQKKLPLIK